MLCERWAEREISRLSSLDFKALNARFCTLPNWPQLRRQLE